MMAKVPMSEVGTATKGMSVARGLRRNTKTTRMTRQTDTTKVLSTVKTEARMVTVLSTSTVVLIPAGSTASRNGNCALTRSTVWMMLAPGCRKTVSTTPLVPSMYPAVRMFCVESSTPATSDRRIAWPL